MAWLSWHGYASGQAHWSGRAAVLELQMEASRRPATREPLRSEKHGILLPFEDEGLVALLMAMRSELLRGCPSGPAFATNLSAALAAHIAAAYPERLVSGSTSTLSEKDLRRLCDYIDEHLARSLVVDDLAALFGLGTSQFSRRLKASTGMSPHQFLTQRRMDRAHGLLLQSHTLADVARAVGIPNPSHFIQVFRRQTGITPGQARTTLRSLPVESSSKDVLNA